MMEAVMVFGLAFVYLTVGFWTLRKLVELFPPERHLSDWLLEHMMHIIGAMLWPMTWFGLAAYFIVYGVPEGYDEP